MIEQSFLMHLRKLFKTKPDDRPEPSGPMTDHELGRAMREVAASRNAAARWPSAKAKHLASRHG
jgi:hypothetical protein